MFSHPFNETNASRRLLQEYLIYGSLYVAFDYDNTIYDYHHDGGDYTEVIELLKRASDAGFKMILFTAEDNLVKLSRKVCHTMDLGIRVDYVNESPVIPNAKKPYYNILLDDRAGLESAYNNLKYVLDYVETQSY